MEDEKNSKMELRCCDLRRPVDLIHKRMTFLAIVGALLLLLELVHDVYRANVATREERVWLVIFDGGEKGNGIELKKL